MRRFTAQGLGNSPRSESLLARIDAEYRLMTPQEMFHDATLALDLARDRPALRCRALKEQANALREMGDFTGALRALDEADQEAALTPASTFESAIMMWARAYVMWQTGYYERARTLVRAAHSVFCSYGDMARADRAWQLVAAILYDEGQYNEALREYQAHGRAARRRGDSTGVIVAYGHIALCYGRMQDHSLARLHFWIAIRGCKRLGMGKYLADMQRGLARLEVVETGVRGFPAMQAARERFEALGMAEDVVVTDILTVEALLEHDPGTDVAQMCRRIANQGAAMGLRVAAANALAILADQAESQRATVGLLHQVERVFEGRLAAVEVEPTALEM